MKTFYLNRRQVLRTTAMLGAASLFDMKQVLAAAEDKQTAKTPPLSAQEITAIEAALGKKGNYNEEQSTLNISLPRGDLKVKIKGEEVPTSFGFGGWVAFKKALDGKSTVLMSDTVLLQEEVNPLISAAHANGLEVSAIHNHFFYEEPRIFYMHVHGVGEPADLARKYAASIRDSKLYPANQPKAAGSTEQPATARFDIPSLDAIVKHKGSVNGPTYKYTVGRDDLSIKAMGAELTAAIGLNSWATFAGTKEKAHIAGDIAMLEHEVNPVIKVLRQNGLEVVAVHNHMLGDDPRMIFLHYYGNGQATDLAKGFRAAINMLGKEKPGMPMRH
ncbi:DUF1259 domain-containing protein [Pontibacter diazotrophicus]|nr:DUF1259 domain-containing protein [Pontibacter diazotrophicus]